MEGTKQIHQTKTRIVENSLLKINYSKSSKYEFSSFPLEDMLQMFAPAPQPELIVCDRRAAVVERER